MVLVAAICAAVLGGVYWVYQSYYGAGQGAPYGNNEDGQSATGDDTKDSASKPATLSYTAAVKLYTDRRIQFDENCAVEPEYATFKKGTVIMLDNRASKAKTISLDSQKYSLCAYGFKIVTLSTAAKLPHTIMIDCGTGQNNGRILLQQ